MNEREALNETLFEMMQHDAGLGVPVLSDREMAVSLLDSLDYEAQLVAITDLLRRNEEAGRRAADRMKQLDADARHGTECNDREIDEWGEQFYFSIYQDAAHSMAALGMLAPLFESMFYQAFQAMSAKYENSVIASSDPRNAAFGQGSDFWNCRYVVNTATGKKKIDLVKGIEELSTAVGLQRHLRSDLGRVLGALFAYRNQMFHNGFEWPLPVREKFAQKIASEGWEQWFASATSGGEPWIFYMTERLIAECVQLLHCTIESLGAWCRHHQYQRLGTIIA